MLEENVFLQLDVVKKHQYLKNILLNFKNANWPIQDLISFVNTIKEPSDTVLSEIYKLLYSIYNEAILQPELNQKQESLNESIQKIKNIYQQEQIKRQKEIEDAEKLLSSI